MFLVSSSRVVLAGKTMHAAWLLAAFLNKNAVDFVLLVIIDDGN